MKYKLLEKVPRKCLADCCEIVFFNGKKCLKTFVTGGKGKHSIILAEGEDIVVEGGIYVCLLKSSEYTLCRFEKEKRLASVICKKCRSYFLKDNILFFQNKDIWYCFYLTNGKYCRLGVLRDGFWMLPRDRLRGGCNSVDVYFFYEGKFVTLHGKRVVKAYNRPVYFVLDGVSYFILTDFGWDGDVPVVGRFLQNLTKNQLDEAVSIKGINKRLFL